MTLQSKKLLAFTKKVADLADKPSETMTAANIKAQFDAAPEELRGTVNSLIDGIDSEIADLAGTGRTTETIKATNDDLQAHKQNSSNPHSTTAAQVGAYTTSQVDTKVSDLAGAGRTTETVKGASDALNTHKADTTNPHSTTAAQVGAYTTTQVDAKVSDLAGAGRTTETIKGVSDSLSSHTSNTSNPHNTTASQVGAIPTTEKGVASGVATLGVDGKVPSSQLPASGGGSAIVPATLVVAAYNSKGPVRADYGCTGTNDHTTIQTAVDALPASGGKVVLLEGTFTVSGSVLLKSNVSLEGQGNGTVITLPNGFATAGFYIIKNADQTNGNTGISVSKLKFDGNKANMGGGAQTAINFSKVIYSSVRDITVTNMKNYAIYLSNSGASGYNTIIGNTISGCGSYGMYLASTLNNIIKGNVVQGCSNHGIYASATFNNNVIQGNIFQGNTGGSGIYLDSSNNNTVSGNSIHGNGQLGIYLTSASNNTVTGNTVLENSQSTNLSYDNIQLANSSNNNNVQGNTCRQGALTNKPAYGIRVNDSTCTGNFITNNDLTTGGATGAFLDSGASTVTTAGNKVA